MSRVTDSSANTNTFAGMLRRQRIAAGWTQEQLAERAQISVRTIRYLEHGMTAPREATAWLLADAFDIPEAERAAFLSPARMASTPRPMDRGVEINAHTNTGAPPRSTPTAIALTSDMSAAHPQGCHLLATPLPLPPTTLLGRATELARAASMLRSGAIRLLTVTGPPGVGKTRLALEVARLLDGEQPDGTVFVSLAPVADLQRIPLAIAKALALETADADAEAAADAFKQLLRRLGERRVLLVLDNFEHLLAAAPLIADLLAQCGRVQLVVTSRVPLHVRGEQELPLLPLALPMVGDEASLERLHQVASVSLFLRNAQAIQPDFALTRENAADIAEICRRLDGLPLALELVAPRLRLLPPHALLARLEHRLTVLVNGPVDLPKRQQTLRTALSWSYDLLPEVTRRVFCALAVFADGCTLSAAEALCQAMGVMMDTSGMEGGVARCLAELAEHHLIVTECGLTPYAHVLRPLPILRSAPLPATGDQPEDEPRITMLQTVREYAAELSHGSGVFESLARAHARYYCDYAEEASRHLSGSTQEDWLRRIDREYPNLLTALRWALGAADQECGLRLGAALGPYWFVRGQFAEGQEWLERVLTLSSGLHADLSQGADSDLHVLHLLRIRVLSQAAKLATRQGEYGRAAALLEEALPCAREQGDLRLLASILNARGIVASNQGYYPAARTTFLEGLSISRSLHDTRAMSAQLGNLANIAYQLGDFAAAATICEATLAIDRQHGDTRNIAATLSNWGRILCAQGDFVTAEQRLLDSLALRQALGEPWGIGHVLVQLADVALAQSKYAEAFAYVAESEPWQTRTGDRGELANRLRCLGDIAYRRGRLDEATDYYQESLSQYRAIERAPDIAFLLMQLGAVARDQHRDDAALHLCREALHLYRKLGMERAVAHCLDVAATLANDRNQARRAERLTSLALAARVHAASVSILTNES